MITTVIPYLIIKGLSDYEGNETFMNNEVVSVYIKDEKLNDLLK